MNKKYLLLLLLPLVIGCGTSSSNPTTSSVTPTTTPTTVTPTSKPIVLDIASVLSDLNKGVKVSVEMDETYDNTTKKLYLQNAVKTKEFSFIQYKDETRKEAGIHEYYVGKENDSKNLIYSTRLNANNEYSYYSVYNPKTSNYFTWDDGYNNAFSTLSVESFDKVNDFTYSLKNELLSSKSNEFSTLLYGNPGLVLTSLSLVQTKDQLEISSTLKFEDSYAYNAKAIVLQKGESVEMDYRMKPFADVEDETFAQMLNSLKQNNYTLTIENYDDDFLDSTSVYYSEADKVYYETGEYKAGFYEIEEGLVQEVKKEDEDFYKVGSPMEGSLDEVRASFRISRACFDKADNIYTLKKGVEGSFSSITVLETLADEFANLTIKIEDSKYTFTNVRNSLKTVVTFTDIGTTSCGYTSDSVLEPVAGASWADVLDEESFALLMSIAGEEAYNIPVPEGYAEWAMEYSEDEITFALLLAEGSETLEDDIFVYAYQLMDAGYILYEEEVGYVGEGLMFLKEVEVNGESHILCVELVDYNGAFAVVVYIAE